MWNFLGGIAQGVMGLFGANQQVKGQQDTNAANAQMAREQMAFQERMSNTAHQREVTDLKAAGLNPILSANAGSSTPGGAMANFQNPYANRSSDYLSSAKAVTSGASDIADVMLKASQAKVALSSAAKIRAETPAYASVARGISSVDNVISDFASALGRWSAKFSGVRAVPGSRMFHGAGGGF